MEPNEQAAPDQEQELKQKITDLVEQRLAAAQKHKEYKDQGRKSGSRKERIAYQVISLHNLEDIEEDPILAEKLTTKNKIWPEVNVEEEKASGTGSGACYLKYQYQRALAVKPFNTKESRLIYVTVLTAFQELLSKAKTFAEVEETAYIVFSDAGLQKIYPDIVNAQFKGSEKYERRYYYGSRIKIIAESIFGKSFINLTRKSYGSQAVQQKFFNAKLYDPYPADKAADYLAKVNEAVKRRTTELQEAIEKIRTLTDPDTIFRELNHWYAGMIRKADFNQEPLEKWKESIITSRSNQLARFIAKPVEIPAQYQARGESWAWAYEKKERKETTKTELPKINTSPYASRLIRNNGIEVAQIGTKGVKDHWGLAAVQYGNGLSDKESEAVTYFLNGALQDLAEVLNVDLARIHQIGQLGIDFATRGTSGSAATYWSSYKVINLNKRSGDGTLAHEWGHFLDNLLALPVSVHDQTKLNGQFGSFSTENKANDPDINLIIIQLMNFIIKGNGTETVKIKISKEDNAYVKGIEDKGGYEKTIEHYKARYAFSLENVQRFNGNRNLRSLFGAVLFKFDVSSLELDLVINSSYQYYYSSKAGNNPKYWCSKVELFARAFEMYVTTKLAEKGMSNNFLQANRDYWRKWGIFPYPDGAERLVTNEYFDRLFDLIRAKLNVHPIPGSFDGKRVAEDLPNSTLGKAKKGEEESIIEEQEEEETQEEKLEEVLEVIEEEKETAPIYQDPALVMLGKGLQDLKDEWASEIITDAATVQKIKNSIKEGELTLRAGTFNGRKLSPEELAATLAQVNRERKKIGMENYQEPDQAAEQAPAAEPAAPAIILPNFAKPVTLIEVSTGKTYTTKRLGKTVWIEMILVNRTEKDNPRIEKDRDLTELIKAGIFKEVLASEPQAAAFKFSAVTNWDNTPELFRKTVKVSPAKKFDFDNFEDLYRVLKPIISTDELRPVYCGIYFDSAAGEIAATDAHKLIKIKYPTTRSGIYTLSKAKQIEPIEGQYPKYNYVIPQDFTKTGPLDVEKILAYAECAIRFSNETTHQIEFNVEDVKIGFNGDFLIDVINAMLKLGVKDFTGCYVAPNKAFLIKGSAGSAEVTGLVMPVMLHSQGTDHKPADYLGACNLDYDYALNSCLNIFTNELTSLQINGTTKVEEFKTVTDPGGQGSLSPEMIKAIYQGRVKNHTLPVLNYAFVNNGILQICNLTTTVEVKADLKTGLYNITDAGLIRDNTKNFEDPTEYGFPKHNTDQDIITSITLSQEDIESMLLAYKFTGKDELRPGFTAINLRYKDGKLAISSTDQYSVYYDESTTDATNTLNHNITVSPLFISWLAKLQGPARIEFTTDQAIINGKNLVIYQRLTDFNFPDVLHYIDKDPTKHITFSNTDYKELLKAAKANTKAGVYCDFSNNKVTIKDGTQKTKEIAFTVKDRYPKLLEFKRIALLLMLARSEEDKDNFNNEFGFGFENFIKLDNILADEVNFYYTPGKAAGIFLLEERRSDSRKILPLDPAVNYTENKYHVGEVVYSNFDYLKGQSLFIGKVEFHKTDSVWLYTCKNEDTGGVLTLPEYSIYKAEEKKPAPAPEPDQDPTDLIEALKIAYEVDPDPDTLELIEALELAAELN